MDDTEYNQVLFFLKQGVAPIHWSEEQKLFCSHNIFVFKNTLHKVQSRLPVARRHELLKIILSVHINSAGEHLEEEATTCCLKQHFHVADPEAEVQKFIESCNLCLRRRLQHTRHLLVERHDALVAKMHETKSLHTYRRKFFDLQSTINALSNDVNTTKSKLIICEAMNQRLMSNNTSITEELNRKLCENLELQEKYNSLKTTFASKSIQEKAANEMIQQKETFKNMWHLEAENNKSLRMQFYEKSKSVLDLQSLFKKKIYDLDKMRCNVNFLQSICSAQANQITELQKLVRQSKDPRADDCQVVAILHNKPDV